MKKKIIAVGALALIILVSVLTVVGCKSTSSTVKPTPPPPSTTAPAPASSAPAPPPTTSAPPPPAAPSTPSLTTDQQQAVDAAQSYLSDGQGFSQQGLLQQLSSSYGSGFSAADAQFAVNYLNPNWDAQAVEAAQGYMTTQPGWSASGLEQQLTSSYGSGFTQAQAEYAVSKVGL